MKSKNLKNLEQFLRRRKFGNVNKISNFLINKFSGNNSVLILISELMNEKVIKKEEEFNNLIEKLIHYELIKNIDNETFSASTNLMKYLESNVFESKKNTSNVYLENLKNEIEILKNEIENLKIDVLENKRRLNKPNELWKLRSNFIIKKDKNSA
ncbi:hypothetical protein QEJ31_07075 [Pigmentibacter sp. JX0631]|uniref:hypothetical protein n=1 Tax=Pigmentibacter sp. JX0631 TaxID=2976982 RepID=UPI0024699583|nr:hypothetical protein [Pigmentibacter sp. JX0631]WGL61354.1 hypothetical protein QEJ31_07075 [Pigmentibacter sp. JX0631]